MKTSVRAVPATVEQKTALSQATATETPFPRVWLHETQLEVANTYYVKGLVSAGLFVLVYGPSGDGKTFFVGDVVGHVAVARQWRGRRVRQCLVVYVASEAGASILPRFFGWREERVSESYKGRIPLAIITRGANLLDLGEVEALLLELHAIEKEAEMPLGIVVFDTLSRSTPGSEEGAADFSCAIDVAGRLRDEFGASTIFVHHSGKDATKGARGHSSLFAAADTVIAVVERVATVEKSRDGTTGEQFAFDLKVVELGLDEDGDPITTCIVEPIGTPAARPKVRDLSGVAKVSLQALQEAVSKHGVHMPGTSTIPQGVKAVQMDHWRAQFTLRYGSEGRAKRDGEAVRKAFQRGREALLKVSAVGISDPYCWLLT